MSEQDPTITTNENSSTSTEKGDIRVLLVYLFLFYLSFGIINPVNVELFEKINSAIIDPINPTHQKATTKHSTSLYGFLFALPGVIFFFVSPITGNLSDRFGRKRFLTLFAALYATIYGIYFVLCRFVTTTSHSSNFEIVIRNNALYLYIFAKILQGFCLDVIPMVNSYIADHADKKDLTFYFSYVLAIMGLSTAIGPVMSGTIYKQFGLNYVFGTIFCISIFTTWFILFFLKENEKGNMSQNITDTSKKDSKPFLSEIGAPFKSLFMIVTQADAILKSLIISKFISAFISVGFFCIITQFTRLKFEYGPQENGFLLTLVGITAVLSNSILAKPIAYLSGSESNNLIIAGIANGLLFLSCVLIRNGDYFYYGMSFFLIGAKEDPLRSSMISKVFDPNQQGILNGCLGSITTLGRILAPVIFSFLLDVFTTSNSLPNIVDAPFIAMTVAQFVGVAFIFRAKLLMNENKTE
ncbi:hypothetical protein FDP41_009260 [Naegleria fowleri]|uniref:Major facilitator superfamily (MFS) profile domain-containing protein n=1 Tax=Naegleria fowleri TaxID=5763 RepID=A0A6A5B247_NAEFO|nr:uncharacterized protein FDP41_009260 [Naegleria fowleri]KAF0972357.1 hypothetical protein FDP41_009260 [Naegleria fowleri]CAG4711255.1 unnamed protein product [Naegleria fowleri]